MEPHPTCTYVVRRKLNNNNLRREEAGAGDAVSSFRVDGSTVGSQPTDVLAAITCCVRFDHDLREGCLEKQNILTETTCCVLFAEYLCKR